MNEELERLCALMDVVRSEADTVTQYMRSPKTDATKPMYDEIISDELNHALIALLTFAQESGIKIAADNVSDLLTDDLFTEE